MYIFVPGYYAGIDFVYISYEQGFSEGDIISWGEIYGICIGNNISCVERYTKERFPPCEVKVVKKSFFSKKTMLLIHWMVSEWFTTYKKIFPLFISKNWEKYLDIKSDIEKDLAPDFDYNNGFFIQNTKKINGQQLFVFPDLWTLYNSFDDEFLKNKGVQILYSSMTNRQKMLAYNNIKSGNIHTLLSTPSEIFKDWYDLKKISFVDPYKRYYDPFKDPRYKVGNVLDKIAEIYNIKVDKFEV